MKVLTVVGARPQFIKAAAVSRAVRSHPDLQIDEVMVHTGQHYDANMSKIFFDELDIPRPAYNLEVAGGGHAEMTGRMLQALEPVMLRERPHWVLVYGDTNSTLAGALAAAKLNIPIAHVEAGLRSFNMRMPEEVNRVVADRVSKLMFCPTTTAVENLRAEGLTDGVRLVGDVMYDVALHFGAIARRKAALLERHSLRPGTYVLVTCHRAENTDAPEKLATIFSALKQIAQHMPVVLPLHPRTRIAAVQAGLMPLLDQCVVIDPLSYLDMVAFEQDAAAIMTDSGGVQKEAFFFGVPCITVRTETEWVETVELGWNRLVATETAEIVQAVLGAQKPQSINGRPAPYGSGQAALAIVRALASMQ
jgi:UDP-GlcNAc3NAcA epimerase